MKKIFISALVALCGFTASYAQQASFLSNNHCLYRISQESQNQKCLLLPVQESAEIANIKVIADNKQVKAFNVKLAKDHVDYYVPLYMNEFAGLKGLALDIHVNGDYSKEGLNALTCWENMKFSDSFDMKNREQYRPVFHHTPVYGWMNDPNGMFYKDGVWNLYFQYNPYGSQWENMTWGHSTSTDLVHWKFQGAPIQPDAIGTIFSGSAVVDKNNTAGLGKGAVVALYTSAGENQTQSMAYSTDNGKTFTKYEGNPIITSTVPDFRDPHMFWNEDIKKWNMIMAVGQHMEIYSSDNLKDWKYESSFGEKYGNHGGVWECPDLMKMKVRGTGKEKWMLICNINPGGPSGGSATQYFIGDFDGHKFTCDSKPEVTKWMDYGKDHYATVSFDNAPNGRRVAIAWMSNWQYGARRQRRRIHKPLPERPVSWQNQGHFSSRPFQSGCFPAAAPHRASERRPWPARPCPQRHGRTGHPAPAARPAARPQGPASAFSERSPMPRGSARRDFCPFPSAFSPTCHSPAPAYPNGSRQ